MAYAVDNAQQFNDFLVAQYGFSATQNEINSFFTSGGFPPSGVSVDTAQVSLGVPNGANLEVLTAGGANGATDEIHVATTSGEALQFVVDQGPFPGSEDFDVTGNGNIGVMLTAPTVDFSLSGSGSDTVFAGTGTDTIDAGNTTGDNAEASIGNNTFFTGSGNETVQGGNGNDTFNVNYITGEDHGTNILSITGGNSGNNVANFNDNMSDAQITQLGGVTTISFETGANQEQDITISNVQTLNFLDGTIPG